MFLIKEVQALAKKLERTPLYREFENRKKAVYRFGSWNNFLIVAGLEVNLTINDFNNISNEGLLEMVKKELIRIKSTTFEDYNKYKSNKSPSYSYIKDRTGLRWNEILQKLGFDLNLRNLTNEELLEQLRTISEKIGKTPSINDLLEMGINASIYHYKFGSYNRAIKLSGLDINFERNKVIHTNEQLLEMYIDLCNTLGGAATSKDIDKYLEYNSDTFVMRFGSINNLRNIAGYEQIKYTKKYTKEIIRIMLMEEYNKNNRKLTNNELNQLSKEVQDFPSISTICRHFKTTKISEVWEEIIETSVHKKHSEEVKQSLIKEVCDLAKELGKTPTSIEFELSGRAKYVFGSWNKFLAQAELEVNEIKTNFNGFTKQEILELVSAELERIGTTKSTDYIKLRSVGLPSYGTILKLLGVEGWNDLLEMLHIEPNMKKSRRKKKTTKCKVQACNSVGSGKGYCNKHYLQVRRHGYVKDNVTEKEKQMYIDRMRNRKARADNITGIKGVNLLSSGRYKARIVVDYKEVSLGVFSTIDEAKQARMKAEKRYWGKIYTPD